ncbi:YggS family pyridoxal phosphate-dependent enzyme [candidate division WOR-3 bacterium]|nr:YggS family pyridoxal phosphate-dependent enzyme [candidate division WOR-3 bacterium]
MVKKNLSLVKERIAAACERVGREASEVGIVAVTKTHPPDVVRQAIDAGIETIGENRVQEAEAKYAEIGDACKWHLVGHLQRNKVKKALEIFEMIHSLDSARLADEIEKEAVKQSKSIPCLIEVNTSGEQSKFGVAPDNLAHLVAHVFKCEHIKLVGLMTIGPLTDDQVAIRKSFSRLRTLRDRIENVFGHYLPHLSMGMSDDFEIAIEEGATLVRLGRVLFGPRGA